MAHAKARRWGSFPTTADVGIWASGAGSAELLEALALGLVALETELPKVRPREERTVSVSATDAAGLVVAFLTELLVLEEATGFLARRVRVYPVGEPPTALLARLTGEPFDPARHPRRKEVKAITLHELRFDPAHGSARVIVDI